MSRVRLNFTTHYINFISGLAESFFFDRFKSYSSYILFLPPEEIAAFHMQIDSDSYHLHIVISSPPLKRMEK